MTENKYRFREWEIPEYMRPSIEEYIKGGQRPEGFLQAILENNFIKAMEYADNENIKNIQAYGNFLYNHVPVGAWGSEENVESWINKGRKELFQTKRSNFDLSEQTKKEKEND